MRQPTMLRRLPWLAATAALTLLCVPRDQARADEKSDLIYKIEGRLRDAASALAYLPSESSESPIDRARDYVREAHGYADQLKQVAGDDSDARRIAENFRDIEDDWNDAANQLRQLKGGQRRAEPVATACTTRDEELKRKAGDFGRANDPDGLSELPRLAATAQDATRRELDELRSHDGRMDDYADYADDFRGDGPWRDLTSATASAAQQTYAVWRKSWEATQTTCYNLTLGVDHPTVKQVLADLSNSAGGRKAVIEQLNRDARDLGSALAGVSEDSGMGSVERAKSLLQSIERGLETLGRTATTDRETKVILEKWPEGVRQLKEALDDLEDLKVHQHDMDPLPEKCALKERELKDAIARNGDDADGIDELPKLAEQMAEPVRAGLAKADERMREEEGDRDRAKAVSVSEGPWSDIRAAEQRDADETFRTYEDGYKKTKDACADVIKGKDSPIAKAAVESLQKKSSGRDDLVKVLETKIDSAAQRLNGAASRTGDGDVTAAVTLGNEMTDALARLRSTPGNDRRVKEVLERWPGYVEQYKAAVANLVLLKRAQYDADGLVAECKRDDDALLDYVAQFKNPAGIAPIEARAAKDQASTEARLQPHRSRRSQLDAWRGAAAGFQLGDGKWSYLSGYVRSAAQGMFDYWVAREAEGEKACDGLLKGAAHPMVAQVLNALRGRMPPLAAHASKHDSTCTGVSPGGFCMVDNNCLDGTCTDNVCARCPSRDDGRCHPPGTCDQSDYSSRYSEMKKECGRPRSANSQMTCAQVIEACNAAQACVNSRLNVQECFRGGDTRHMEELNTARGVAAECESILEKMRAAGKCS